VMTKTPGRQRNRAPACSPRRPSSRSGTTATAKYGTESWWGDFGARAVSGEGRGQRSGRPASTSLAGWRGNLHPQGGCAPRAAAGGSSARDPATPFVGQYGERDGQVRGGRGRRRYAMTGTALPARPKIHAIALSVQHLGDSGRLGRRFERRHSDGGSQRRFDGRLEVWFDRLATTRWLNRSSTYRNPQCHGDMIRAVRRRVDGGSRPACGEEQRPPCAREGPR